MHCPHSQLCSYCSDLEAGLVGPQYQLLRSTLVIQAPSTPAGLVGPQSSPAALSSNLASSLHAAPAACRACTQLTGWPAALILHPAHGWPAARTVCTQLKAGQQSAHCTPSSLAGQQTPSTLAGSIGPLPTSPATSSRLAGSPHLLQPAHRHVWCGLYPTFCSQISGWPCKAPAHWLVLWVPTPTFRTHLTSWPCRHSLCVVGPQTPPFPPSSGWPCRHKHTDWCRGSPNHTSCTHLTGWPQASWVWWVSTPTCYTQLADWSGGYPHHPPPLLLHPARKLDVCRPA